MSRRMLSVSYRPDTDDVPDHLKALGFEQMDFFRPDESGSIDVVVEKMIRQLPDGLDVYDVIEVQGHHSFPCQIKLWKFAKIMEGHGIPVIMESTELRRITRAPHDEDYFWRLWSEGAARRASPYEG